MAKLSGATTVVIADIDSGRVNYALSNGFAHKGYIVTPRRHSNETSEKFAAAKEISNDVMHIASLNDPDFEGADVTFDCTGKEVCMQAGLYVSLRSPTSRGKVGNLCTGNKARRSARHGWHGDTSTDASHIHITPQRSRHYRHFPLCEYIPYWHENHFFWCSSKPGQHGHASI
jgi:threonine dehydrogenase-like Zn-dependent dehydrogenase